MRKTIEGLWLSKISLQSRVASCHLINLLLLKKLTYPMWCLWCYLHFGELWVLQNFVYSVHIPFPSTQSGERNSLHWVVWDSSAELSDSLRLFDSAAVRDAQCGFLYKPQGASRHCFGWFTHGKWLVPADVLAVAGLGTERPSPCLGAPASAFGNISWLQQRQWWKIPPSTPWLRCRSSQAELWGIVPFRVEGISGELVLVLAGVPTTRGTQGLFD